MAVVTKIPWTFHPRPTHHREYRSGPQFLIMRLMTTRAGQLTPIRRRCFEVQQFTQGGGSGLMESRAQHALNGFQIRTGAVATFSENTTQEQIYFPRNFLMDCSSRFFS